MLYVGAHMWVRNVTSSRIKLSRKHHADIVSFGFWHFAIIAKAANFCS